MFHCGLINKAKHSYYVDCDFLAVNARRQPPASIWPSGVTVNYKLITDKGLHFENILTI